MGFGMKKFNSINSKKVEGIQNEAGFAGMYESFMEAGPQAVTQLVIIFSTGYISIPQMVSLPISVISLSMAASRAFFIMRGPDETDPDPDMKTVCLRILPWMLPMVINSMILWTIIG